MIAAIKPVSRVIAAAMTVCGITFGAWAQAPDIAQMAPRRAFVLASIPDFEKFRTAFEKSELGKLWAEPSVQKFVEEMTREQSDSLDAFFKEARKPEDFSIFRPV